MSMKFKNAGDGGYDYSVLIIEEEDELPSNKLVFQTRNENDVVLNREQVQALYMALGGWLEKTGGVTSDTLWTGSI